MIDTTLLKENVFHSIGKSGTIIDRWEGCFCGKRPCRKCVRLVDKHYMRHYLNIFNAPVLTETGPIPSIQPALYILQQLDILIKIFLEYCDSAQAASVGTVKGEGTVTDNGIQTLAIETTKDYYSWEP